MEWLAAILGAIPIIGSLLVKLLDLLTMIPSILKAIPQVIWDVIVYAVKWLLGFIDGLIKDPLESLYKISKSVVVPCSIVNEYFPAAIVI